MKYERIKNFREDNDWSQEYVSKIINVSQRTYAYYESGERMIPPHVLKILALFYDTSVDYLVGLTDERKPHDRKEV